MTNRRQFLKQASLVSASAFIPGFIRKSRAAQDLSSLTHSKTLVVIQTFWWKRWTEYRGTVPK